MSNDSARKLNIVALLACLSLTGASCVASAQNSPKSEKTSSEDKLVAISAAGQTTMDPEAMKERMRAGMSMYLEQMKMRLEAMTNPEIATRLAKFSRTYYEALIAEGFSEQEAMQLVIAVGIPTDR